MRVYQERIEASAPGRGLVDITGQVAAVVTRSEIATGLCTVFLQHTSAGLIIQENADPAVLRDLARWIEKVAPEASTWEHDDEGPDDMPAHLRTVLTRTSETIPITAGRLVLGTWQALYLWEHRSRSRRRSLIVHVTGVP